MIPAKEIMNNKYDEIYEEEIRGIERRRQQDPNLTIDMLEGTLQALYNIEGDDWEGRGPLRDEMISAQIAAHEAYIAQWKKETSAQ
ncbi:MAG: hypothetical protein K6E51_13880 [Treponema sp.]|nr:hypothetical protein [Treponema sp.]